MRALLRIPESLFYSHMKYVRCFGKARTISFTKKIDAPVSMAYTAFEPEKPSPRTNLPPIVIMHGLMGSRTNWKSLGKTISNRTGRTVYTVDARNHGESPHTEGHTYQLLAEDITGFLQERSIPQAVLIGHSMGGRAVMAVALTEPSIVEKLVVLDISPIGTSKSISTLPRFLEIMRRVQVPPTLNIQEARSHVDDLLKPVIQDGSIRQFLLTNLIWADGEYRWRLNVEGIARNFNPHISTFPAVLSSSTFEGDTAFIGGALSDYLRAEDEDHILEIFPQASFHFVDGAGHWLHSDKPFDFLNLVVPLINP